MKASEVGLATDSNTASNASDATEVEGTGLPNTGTDSGPLLLLGGGFIAVGRARRPRQSALALGAIAHEH